MQPSLAESGPEALAQLDAAATAGTPFRVALLDVLMPDMDGFMLAERIRERPHLQDCRLIILSSAGQTENWARCQELGISRYLIKPVKQSDLRDSMVRVLSAGEEPRSPAGTAPPAVARARRTLRVLLAEDGLVNRRVAREFLERRGHRVVAAKNGREAVDAVAREAFDLVLMDVQMPEMDGFEATREIRRKEQSTGTHIPIVAMTAGAFKDDRERCLDAGMDDYLSKPIRSAALYEIIEAIAVPRRADQESIPAESIPAESIPAESIMDQNVALDQIGGDEELLRELMTIFIEESGKLVPALRVAIEQQDTAEVRRLAHTIKGAASHLAAPSVAETALYLETMGKKGELAGADEALTRLEGQVERLKRAAEDWVGS
jgi:CheY-like chemotaxis protein